MKDENLDLEPGWWFTILMLLPFIAAATVALKIRELLQRP